MSSDLSVRSVPEPTSADAVSGRGEWWLLDRLALLISALSGLLVFGFTFRGGWFVDDFVDFGLAQESGLRPAYVRRLIYGHPQPGTRILDWLMFRVAPMNYPLAAALSGLGIAFMVWMLYRVLRLTFRPSPLLLIMVGLAGFSVVWLPGTEWWAAACETVPCVISGTLMVHSLLRCYLGPRRWRWGLLAGLWLIVGLAFFEVTLIAMAFAACYLLSVAARRFTVGEIVRVVRQSLPAYLVLFVISVVYLFFYETHKFVQSNGGYSGWEMLHFLWVSWSSALVPCLFGGPISSGPLFAESRAFPPRWWLVLCQLLLLAMLFFGIRRRGWRALIGWAYFVPLYLIASFIIASARLHVYGPAIGREFRYVAGLMPLLILTVALTLLRPSFDRAEFHTKPVSVAASTTDRWRRIGLPVLALAAVLAVFLASAVPISRRWSDANNVVYGRNLRASVQAREAAGPYSVYTTFVTGDVSAAIDGKYSLVPRLANLLTGRKISADDLTKPMYVADHSGHLVPAKLATYATVPGDCAGTAGPAPLQLLSRALPAAAWTVQLNYSVAAPTTLRFLVNSGVSIQETTDERIAFPVSGSGRLTFQLRQQYLQAFGFDADHAGACISKVRLGRPVPGS